MNRSANQNLHYTAFKFNAAESNPTKLTK